MNFVVSYWLSTFFHRNFNITLSSFQKIVQFWSIKWALCQLWIVEKPPISVIRIIVGKRTFLLSHTTFLQIFTFKVHWKRAGIRIALKNMLHQNKTGAVHDTSYLWERYEKSSYRQCEKLEKLFIRCIMHQPCQQSMRAVIVKYQPLRSPQVSWAWSLPEKW